MTASQGTDAHNTYLSESARKELVATAAKIVSPGKGILAADESTGTIQKRFDNIGVQNTEENRAQYRELLFTTKGLEEFISGVILFEETLFQKGPSGESMVDMLKKKDICVGIKVDKGLVEIPGTDAEKATQGLDGLAERCQKYYQQGARFAKWRAVLSISGDKPSQASFNESAFTLARYAAICQQNGLVPIVEPEILCDGNHNIQRCAEATRLCWTHVFHQLQLQNVYLPGILLKPNMVTPGFQCETNATPKQIAEYTVNTMVNVVPYGVKGIVFLSGGQSEEDACLNLNAMNALPEECRRGLMFSFSYGRALQATVLKTWAGKKENIPAAQKALALRAHACSKSQLGKYEGGQKTDSLFEKNYAY